MAIELKNLEQLKSMRKAGLVVADTLKLIKDSAQVGMTTIELDEIAVANLKKHNATPSFLGYHGFPAVICASVNEEVVHGIGSLKRILRDGDIISLDVVIEYNGYIGDNAITVPVGAIAPQTAKLLEITESALRIGIQQALPGNRIGDISNAIQTFVESHGFSVVRDMVGHGVGCAMHEEPQIPNFGRRNAGEKIKAGMTLAIEPMVNFGRFEVKTLPDGWTIVTRDGSPSAHFEHTVLTTDSAPEILTILPAPF